MSVTGRGKGWELQHSMWMFWFLSLGFFNWVAFLYIGQRTRHRAWTTWGLAYLAPVVLALLFIATDKHEVSNASAVMTMICLAVGLISPVHAFTIRKEYLLRLEALEAQAGGLQELKKQIAREYSPDTLAQAPQEESGFKHDWKTGALVSRRKFGHSHALLRQGTAVRSMPDETGLARFTRMLFLHQIAVGEENPDVTEPPVELVDVIAQLEQEALIEVDAGNVGYRLSKEGVKRYDTWMEEAQELIKAFDIYGDVDQDTQGQAHFDTGLGKDLRVPVYESEEVDPFLARILLGLNDGEWTDQPEWPKKVTSSAWFQEVFAPVCQAPTPGALGPQHLERLKDQAKECLRRGRPLERVLGS